MCKPKPERKPEVTEKNQDNYTSPIGMMGCKIIRGNVITTLSLCLKCEKRSSCEWYYDHREKIICFR